MSLKFWSGLKAFKICTKAGSLHEISVKLTDAMANEKSETTPIDAQYGQHGTSL